MSRQLYTHARIFTADSRPWAESMVVDGERIAYVGDEATATRIAGSSADRIDLDGATVLPGFVDGHAHVVGTGEAAQQVDLRGADSVAEIQQRIAAWAEAHPEADRIRAHGWAHLAFGDERPHRHMLDAVADGRPVYAQSGDFHSIWVSTAALDELGITAATPAPSGGAIHLDADGPTGLIDETAMHELVWPMLDAATTPDDFDRYLSAALESYRTLGITAATDMALTEDDLPALQRADAQGALTARITAHWRVQPTGKTEENLIQVARAAELASAHHSPWFRVTGIKILIDGTIDGCTAALRAPYADGSMAEPVWSLAELTPVVTEADRLGLQVAMHAIGDEAVRIAVDAIEAAVATNGPAARRHRIEHLEVADPADITRLASLGIIASMQPVHADPAIQENWRAMLGDARVESGYAWPLMTEAGAPLVLGTDSPTASEAPLENMFIAATRKSALDPELPPNLPRFALPLIEAIGHATRDAAWACRAEHDYGRLAAGLYADFIVLDRDIFAVAPESLLDASVVRTVVGGRTVHEAARGTADSAEFDGANA